MHQPLPKCIFITNSGKCNHLEMGRGFLFIGKECVLADDFVSKCAKQINSLYRPEPPKAPPASGGNENG